MTPEQRNAAMDRLEEIAAEIAELEDEYDGKVPAVFIYRLECERDRLRESFPEIKYSRKERNDGQNT